MHYLILSIVCSVAVSILLKISKHKGISINQAVAINYPVAAISVFVLFKPNFSNNFNVLLSEWQILLPLGILLPSVFIIMGECVNRAGIAKSDAAQRLSLFLPILAAFLIFGEILSIGKILAVILVIISFYKFREVYLITTSIDDSKGVENRVVNGVQGWIDCFDNVKLKKVLSCAGAEGPNDVKNMPKLLKKAYELGRKI